MFVEPRAGEGPRTRSDGTMMLRVQRLSWEAPGVLSVELRDPDGGLLPPVEPGAHIDLHVPGGAIRQYSLCGDPADRRVYRIAVLEVSGGQGSGFVHGGLRPGELVAVGGPRNNFRLDTGERYVFIAGGIGVTPLLPMAREAARRGRRWTLHYCVRSAKAAPFLDELAAIPGGDVVLHASDQGTRLSVERELATPADGVQIYCCGPERLMRAVETAAAHWSAGAVRFEWFAPKSDAPRAADAAGDASVVVTCARSGVDVTVPPDLSILDALTAAGIDVPRSCEQGICGTCECGVVEGVPDHRDSILTDAERVAGKTMMVCVSRAKSPRLVLDI
jgi:tetrachlorobenzoquinone reductase